MTPVAELFALIKIKGAQDAAKRIDAISQKMSFLKAGLVNANKALYEMSKAAREMAVNLDMYQLNTGLSGEQLQKLSFQASQAGVSMEELGGTIQHLQNLSAKANLGEGWSPVLSRFGIMPGQDPVTQLNRISAGLKRLNAAGAHGEARQLAHEVGLSDTMYYALMKGTTEEMNKQFVLTQKEQNSLVKLNMQWNKFWFYVKQITVKIQALGSEFQTKILKIMVNAIQGLGELMSRFVSFVDANKELQYIIVAIFAYLNPWLALLGAIALVLEDIFVYFQGGDSITGLIVNWISGTGSLKGLWESFSGALKDVWDILKVIGTVFKAIFESTGAGTGLKHLIIFLNAMVQSAWDLISGLMNMIMALTQHPLVQWALKKLGIAGEVNEMSSAYFDRKYADKDIMRPSIANSQTSGDINVTNKVEVHGDMSEQQAEQLVDNLASQTQDAVKQSSYHTQTGGGMKYEPAVG